MLDPENPKHTHIIERLQTEPIMWLSSVRPDGRPHMVPVWFLWDNGTVLIFSYPNNQKIRNLRNNPTVMMALEALQEGDDIALMEGTAQLLDGSDGDTPNPTMPIYAEKYDFLFKRMKWTPQEMAASYTQAIRITPTRLITI